MTPTNYIETDINTKKLHIVDLALVSYMKKIMSFFLAEGKGGEGGGGGGNA